MARQKTNPPPEIVAPPVSDAADLSSGSYTVLARRYRPQQFADLVGQGAVAQALTNALSSGRVAHAYVFTGARGVGKTSAARILAKALNCVKGPTPTPCNECEICRGISSGEDVDVLEIDGASNRGIDEVREIRQNVLYRPSRARYKIYIIDEVHMLTVQAFNALLKTLEEPPAHVKFIFATTEATKIPITILSRCQRFDFASISVERIVETLRFVVKAEGLQADDDALQLIARRAGGSMRDAQSLLDQLLAFGGDRLTAEAVHHLLGTATDERVLALAAAILERRVREALNMLGQAAVQGLQLGELLDQLIEYWRDLMVAQCAGVQTAELSVPPRHQEALKRQADALPLDTILAGLDILATTKMRLRGSSHGRVLIEMAVVRLSRLDDLIPLSQLAQALAKGSPLPERKTPAAPIKKSAGNNPRAIAPPEESRTNSTVPTEPLPAPMVKLDLTPETLPEVWEEVRRLVGPVVARNLERAGLPAILGPNSLVLATREGYNADWEHLAKSGAKDAIEAALKKITGKAWAFRCEPAAAAPGTTGKVAAQGEQSRHRQKQAEARKQPLVKRAIELFDAQIMEVEDGFGAMTAKDRPEVPEAEEA